MLRIIFFEVKRLVFDLMSSWSWLIHFTIFFLHFLSELIVLPKYLKLSTHSITLPSFYFILVFTLFSQLQTRIVLSFIFMFSSLSIASSIVSKTFLQSFSLSIIIALPSVNLNVSILYPFIPNSIFVLISHTLH